MDALARLTDKLLIHAQKVAALLPEISVVVCS
jgi:hypothetical protein